MKISRTEQNVLELDVEALAVGVYSDGELSAVAAQVDEAAGGLIRNLLETKEISGKLAETTPLYGLSGVKARQVLAVGLGPRDELDRQHAFRSAGAAARKLAGKEHARVAFALEAWAAQLEESAVAGAVVGCQGQDLYRREKKRYPFAELLWCGGSAEQLASGQVLGESVNLTRRLVNEPPQVIYPESFAEEAQRVAADTGLEAEIWDEKRLQDERCGALLAVARGSDRPARLAMLKHNGGGNGPTLALVGKGVTFDSGGLSLKPSESMLTMKCDMAGAATVLGAMHAIAKLKLPVNVIGLMGLVENLPSSKSYKLGDVLTARNGKTIEVHNTDAEGRLVLADVLCVAVDRQAAKIIDLATLTGACVVALGNDVAGVMTNEQSWGEAVLYAAKTCGEPAWPLPMFADYGDQIKAEIADIKNVGEGRWGGAITAAKFLEEFVSDTPWTHLDIAGPSFLEKPKAWLDAGASGCFVRTLVEAARNWPS